MIISSSLAGAVFELQNTTLEYDKRSILRDISITIEAGQRVALIGKSGAGKSTLLRHLRQLQHQHCAWCPQEPGLVASLNVYHNIYMGALERHHSFYNLLNLIKPFSAPLKDIKKITADLKLQDKLFERVESLSGGQQQRVAIGRALYQQKAIFLGDEPVSGLDQFQAEHLLSYITEQHQTLVVALHDTDQALKLCDRIIGLRDGAIFFDCPTHDVTNQQLAALYL